MLEHLYLSGMAFKRDVQDPQTVADIVARIQSPERLRLLYVLTACDIAAVGPGVWTRWKADLLEEAFDMALAVMQGASLKDTHDARIDETMEGFRALMTDWPAADVDAFVQRCRAHFWAVHDSDTLARIARAVRAADQAGRPLALDWHVRTGGRTAEITVYAPDHRGQFARIVAAITLADAGVADAKVMTSRDGMAMDTFLIESQSGAAFDDPRRSKTLLASIEKFVRDEPDVDHILQEVRPRFRSRTDVFRVAPLVRTDNEASASRTVIEIEARDQPGLLLAIAGALLELGGVGVRRQGFDPRRTGDRRVLRAERIRRQDHRRCRTGAGPAAPARGPVRAAGERHRGSEGCLSRRRAAGTWLPLSPRSGG